MKFPQAVCKIACSQTCSIWWCMHGHAHTRTGWKQNAPSS